MSGASLAFRSEFSRPFASTALAGIAVGLGMSVVTGGARVDVVTLLVAPGAGAALAAGITAAWIQFMKVYVNASGIWCYNAWGASRFIAWPDMERVRPINFCGLRYLRVWSRLERNPTWIPLFLSD